MQLFKDMLSLDSTSGREREMGLWLSSRLEAPEVEVMEVGDGTVNVFLKWGVPKVVFCSHMDTVPPYIAPSFGNDRICGRGSCDAKGQVFAMYRACRQLESEGREGFGLLVLSGEETGSHGAKAFAKTSFRAPYLIVGEPTENHMVSASKGTKAFALEFSGLPFHSGYPQMGRSAVDMFVDFMERLRSTAFAEDELLGKTTWNVGRLVSDNPQNILSPSLTCRIYFRTTFSSDEAVTGWMRSVADPVEGIPGLKVEELGGDAPAHYLTLPGFPSAAVSFGSDAPHLKNFSKKIICGPGSIRHAHRSDEHVLIRDLDKAVEMYVKMFYVCK